VSLDCSPNRTPDAVASLQYLRSSLPAVTEINIRAHALKNPFV
jgi:hypothetical protein